MNGTPSALADVLTDCEAHGIKLSLAGDGGLEIEAPQDALTPDLLGRLKAHKAELLAMLRPAPVAAPALPVAALDAPAKATKPVCRCGSTAWRDVPIHDGQSIRRDCGRCRRFLDFVVWHGKPVGSASTP